MVFIISGSSLPTHYYSHVLPQGTRPAQVSFNNTRTPDPSDYIASCHHRHTSPPLPFSSLTYRTPGSSATPSTKIWNSTSTTTATSSYQFLAKWKIILGCMLLSMGPCELHPPQGVPTMTTDRKAHPEGGCSITLLTGYVG